MNTFTGALDDNRPNELKEKDWIKDIAEATLVEWIPREFGHINSFPVRDQDGSGSCFPSSTKVLMEDLSEKEISKIKLGDVVYTHKGNLGKVSHLFKRKWQGTMSLFKIRGLSKELECTNEHPIYVIKGTYGAKPINETANFYKAEDLKKGDWVGLPIINTIKDTTLNSFEKDPDFLWALGLYLAEGSLDKYKVCFSLHKKETYYYERLKKIFNKYGSNVTVNYKKDSQSMTVCLQGQDWVNVFEELGSKLCQNKKINKRLMFLEPSLQMNIVEGVLDGDGSYQERQTVLVSTSQELVRQIKIILLRNGIYSFEQKRKHNPLKKDVWTLEFSKESRYSFVKDNYLFVQIDKKNIKKDFKGGYVYNIEVEGDNSYIVNGVAVHNCVAQSLALILGIENFLEEGKFIEFSAKDIYTRRTNLGMGMIGVEALDIVRKYGCTLEVLQPSQKMGESEINKIDREVSDEEIAKIFKIKDFYQLPFDINKIAQIMESGRKNGVAKPLMVWFRFPRQEWTAEPKISNSTYDIVHHSVVAIDYGLLNGVKGLFIQDSWGLHSSTNKGLRFVSEDYLKRMTFCAYVNDLPNKYEKFEFTRTLKRGDKGDDVKQLQLLLGVFPDGIFGKQTELAVKRFQKSKGLSPDGIVGKLTQNML